MPFQYPVIRELSLILARKASHSHPSLRIGPSWRSGEQDHGTVERHIVFDQIEFFEDALRLGRRTPVIEPPLRDLRGHAKDLRMIEVFHVHPERGQPLPPNSGR